MSPDVAASVVACFDRRGTPWSDEVPRVLTTAFYETPELDTRWRHYLAAGPVLVPPPAQFATIGERIIEFLGPVRNSTVSSEALAGIWPPGGPWR